MYGPNHVPAPVRSQDEFDNAQPVLKAFMTTPVGEAFSKENVRNAVIPAYMGLIKQIDDQMGVLFKWLTDTGRMDDTMIVLTSDHGDFLGDHWMGEKTFFHDASTKVPLIIYDPSSEADGTRGTVCDALVESIDMAATFVDCVAGEVPDHILEGESLLPVLHGLTDTTKREYAICEYDYSGSPIATKLQADVRDAVMFMVANKEWKLIHCEGGYAPMLFDLVNDPDELVDLGQSAEHEVQIEQMYAHLFAWARRPSQRTTRSKAQLEAMRTATRGRGIVLGIYDENDAPLEITTKYRNRKAPPFAERHGKKAGAISDLD